MTIPAPRSRRPSWPRWRRGSRTGRGAWRSDRRSAIVAALSDAGPDDVVLIAGKGHENYQIVGTVKHPFDDVHECQRALGRKTVAA